LILIIPLLLIAAFSIRILPEFPLNTHPNAPGIWTDPRELTELTRGKVGRVNFSHSGLLDFYRAVSSEICGHGNVYNLTLDNVVGHICDHPTHVRLASSDRFLRLHDQSAYQRVYVRGELSSDDVIVSVGRGDFLCLIKRDFITPHIEFVAAAGTRFFVRRNCVGKLNFGQGWLADHRQAISEHAEIHLRNYTDRPLLAKFMLTLDTFEPRSLTIRLNGKVQHSAALIPHHPVSVRPDEFRLLPGDNVLQFDGDAPAKVATDLSPLHLTFYVVLDLIKVSEEDSPPHARRIATEP
jgi:hypothetical protein